MLQYIGGQLLIIQIYMTMNKDDRIKKDFLKTLIIERECFKRSTKFILDGPKYLGPLIDGTDLRTFAVFDNEPEKLLQVAASSVILATVDFGKQV